MDDKQRQIQDIVLSSPEALLNPMGYVREAIRDLGKLQLNRFIEAGSLPNLKCNTKTRVTGDSDAALMVVMDYPADTQAKLSRSIDMFEGNENVRSFLKTCFESHGVNFNKILWMNTVPYCPTKTVGGEEVPRAPLKKEIELCKTYMRYAVDLFHPPMLLLMGNVASNVYFRGKPISKIRGTWQSVHCIPTMPTYSPNELGEYRSVSPERAMAMLNEFKEDIANAMAEYKRCYPNSNLFVK